VKKIAVLGAALTALLVTAPAAWAQNDDKPSCAVAQLAFTDAQHALDEAVAADEAAAAAKSDDEDLARAERALTAAREAALSGGVPTENQTSADAAKLRAELAELEDIPVAERTTAQQVRIDEIKKRLPLIDAVVTAQARLTAARTEAERTDADRLQDVADETDADELRTARDKARQAADLACGRTSVDDPDDEPDNDDDDADDQDDVATPRGGVATGGGPA
jgi:hypothetical protein